MNRRSTRHLGLEVQAEINVTSLVDVAFTLLIIFMITAPIIQGGIEIEVPRAPSAPLQASEGIVITIDREGQLYLDDTPVTLDEFDAAVVQVIRRRDEGRHQRLLRRGVARHRQAQGSGDRGGEPDRRAGGPEAWRLASLAGTAPALPIAGSHVRR